MGASPSSSSRGEEQHEQHQRREGEIRRFSTFRRTGDDARAQIGVTLRGGLNRDLLDFVWMSNGGRAPKTHDALHDVVKALVRDYPALFMQAVDLSFRAYGKAPAALPSGSTHRKMKKELLPVTEMMRETLEGLASRHRRALVRKAVVKSVSAGDGAARKRPRVPFEEFAASFESTTGPWLADRLMQKQFRAGLLRSMAQRSSNALAPVAVVSGKQRPKSPRQQVEEAGNGYFSRAFSFRRRGGEKKRGGGDDDKEETKAVRRAKTMPVRRSASVQEH